jgi:hypothetical protein
LLADAAVSAADRECCGWLLLRPMVAVTAAMDGATAVSMDGCCCGCDGWGYCSRNDWLVLRLRWLVAVAVNGCWCWLLLIWLMLLLRPMVDVVLVDVDVDVDVDFDVDVMVDGLCWCWLLLRWLMLLLWPMVYVVAAAAWDYYHGWCCCCRGLGILRWILLMLIAATDVASKTSSSEETRGKNKIDRYDVTTMGSTIYLVSSNNWGGVSREAMRKLLKGLKTSQYSITGRKKYDL